MIGNNMSQCYYLQIHRIKLQDYLTLGLIVPDSYMEEVAINDIQSLNPSCLLLSKGYINKIDATQLVLEIILKDDEAQKLIEKNPVYLYENAIPISRIKQIFCQDKEVKKIILQDIENYASGYLHEKLFVFFKKNKKIVLNEYCVDFDTVYESRNDLKSKILRYDKLLGMFAFTKNAQMYYFDDIKTFTSYSDGFFKLLSKYNTFCQDESQEIFDLLKTNETFLALLLSDDLMTDDFIENVIQSTGDEEIKEIFSDLIHKPSVSKECLRRLREKDNIYFYICLVYIHKQKEGNQKEYFKDDIAQQIPYEKVEYALACLGLYYGYNELDASEDIVISDKVISKIINTEDASIKFKMDNKLDYIVIESIFNYVFYKEASGLCEYLVYPFTEKISFKVPQNKTFKIFYQVEKKDCFDSEYIKIHKNSIEEIIQPKLSKYGKEITFKHYLLIFVRKYYQYLIQHGKDGESTDPYCKVEDFYEALKNDEKRNLHKLVDVFVLDGK